MPPLTFFDRTGAVINRSGSPAVRHTNASVSCPASLRIHTHANSTHTQPQQFDGGLFVARKEAEESRFAASILWHVLLPDRCTSSAM